MIVKRIYMNNDLRNYNYVIACAETKQAMVIDPYDGNKCLEVALQEGFSIKYIINTHAHWDHTQGNAEVMDFTNAQVYAHYDALNQISEATQGLKSGDELVLGTLKFSILDTPGHTLSHICLLSQTDVPALFCGDTLFNAGAGNCHSGDAQLLYETFETQLALLPDDTQVYPGHDYIENNLNFALDREPGNNRAKQLLYKIKQNTPENQIVTTMALEKQINPFFRLTQPEIYQELKGNFPNLPNETESIFIALRKLRDVW